MSELTIADVERIAALAHLSLTEDEKARFGKQLDDILRLAAGLKDLDTSGVTATAHVLDTMSAERDDVLQPSLTPQAATANAPDAAHEAGLFRVPRVMGS